MILLTGRMFSLARALSLFRHSILSLSLARSLSFSRSRARALSLALARALSPSLPPSLPLSLSLSLSRSLSRALSRALSLALSRALSLARSLSRALPSWTLFPNSVSLVRARARSRSLSRYDLRCTACPLSLQKSQGERHHVRAEAVSQRHSTWCHICPALKGAPAPASASSCRLGCPALACASSLILFCRTLLMLMGLSVAWPNSSRADRGARPRQSKCAFSRTAKRTPASTPMKNPDRNTIMV